MRLLIGDKIFLVQAVKDSAGLGLEPPYAKTCRESGLVSSNQAANIFIVVDRFAGSGGVLFVLVAFHQVHDVAVCLAGLAGRRENGTLVVL